MGKILERLLLQKLNTHIQQNNTLIPEQFGFWKKHVTELQLARNVDAAKINYNCNRVTRMILLDLEISYYTIWREGLIQKLYVLRFVPFLNKTVNTYL